MFCGSSSGLDDRYARLAHDLGTFLAAEDIELIYGGGAIGLMGIVADACMAAGGQVTGVIPKATFTREIDHNGITRLHKVDSMHERKQLMYDLADGFVGLPGGLGTLEELAEAATWTQIGLHVKPLVLLDTNGFWDPLAGLLDHMVSEGFVKPAYRQLIQRCHSPAEALASLTAAEISYADKWF